MFKIRAHRFQIAGGRRRVVWPVVTIYNWLWPDWLHDWHKRAATLVHDPSSYIRSAIFCVSFMFWTWSGCSLMCTEFIRMSSKCFVSALVLCLLLGWTGMSFWLSSWVRCVLPWACHCSILVVSLFSVSNLPPPDIGFDFDFSELKKKSRKKRGSTSTLHQHQSLDMVIFKTRKKEEDFNTDAGLTGFRFVDLELLTDFVDLVSKL